MWSIRLDEADTELLCTIKKRDKTVININQIGETREAQSSLIFEVLWRDRAPGKLGDVLSGKKRREGEPPVLGPDGKERPPTPVILAPTAYYIPEIGGTNATALTQIYNSLAVQIDQHDGKHEWLEAEHLTPGFGVPHPGAW